MTKHAENAHFCHNLTWQLNYIYPQTIVYGVFMSYDKQECMSALEESDEVFYARMKKGLDDVHNGRVTPLDDVYAELSKAISELQNEAKVADAEKFINGLMIS